jgi:NAD(P)H-dependent flavin oxidoreductase YrpB (nitropropane dioxygenase family)
MKTNLCHVLGIEHPIIAAPMGPDLTGPELVAAVSNAGGLGILQAQFCTPPVFRQEIRRVRALTAKPFGVNVLLHFLVEDQVAICLEERVPVLSFFWGDPTPHVERAHAAGVKVFHQVGSVADARRAAAAGVDVIIAQGVEAGGHSSLLGLEWRSFYENPELERLSYHLFTLLPERCGVAGVEGISAYPFTDGADDHVVGNDMANVTILTVLTTHLVSGCDDASPY